MLGREVRALAIMLAKKKKKKKKKKAYTTVTRVRLELCIIEGVPG